MAINLLNCRQLSGPTQMDVIAKYGMSQPTVYTFFKDLSLTQIEWHLESQIEWVKFFFQFRNCPFLFHWLFELVYTYEWTILYFGEDYTQPAHTGVVSIYHQSQ